ncbi:MAG: transketolase [Magnetococcales bacterium]|nr:transketolase [Magnetococcales bacterium]MBF0321409.1 transketolase [Magnetococcales bacterium]
MNDSLEYLQEKSRWVRRETVRLHKLAPGTRLASSLSCVEILCALYYGGVIRHDPAHPHWADRDRLILSKGHGCISFYPILADRGYIPREELERIAKPESILGVIPEAIVPGIETTNGSLGHGLGVGCGMALALRKRRSTRKVFVLTGDGEMNSGAIWEAVMFAGFHRLDNLIMILDDNKVSMLGRQVDILGLAPFPEKLRQFGWHVETVAGHDVGAIQERLRDMVQHPPGKPQALVADTVKGRGVPELERDPLCHVKVFKEEEVDRILGELP